ncbi:MAG: methionine--tRNA ligase [bacterium]|nr:methionine--tRNA ligase [bacterium]
MAKFYVTTAIDYANAKPHLGHAYEKVIADVMARWHRTKGDDVFFLTGTDEHGAKISRSAEAAGREVSDFVIENREEYKKLLQTLNISNDHFVYTADQENHWPGAQKMWSKLVEAGDLYKATYKGQYCVGHEAFVTEKDLKDGVCPDHNKKPELIEEENYFFKLSKYSDQIYKLIESDEYEVRPKARKNEVLAFIKDGIEDISFSRPSKDIPWGIPVPSDPEHTMYVWCDALTNYISALGYGLDNEKEFDNYWPADVHLIGKDILRFHALIWPGMLLAAKLPIPKMLYVHGMIISGGQKMSKTIGNVIDPNEIVNEYGVDAFRYFLMREIPFGDDGDFTKERFADVYEGSLAHGLGNLLSRTTAMIQKYFPEGLPRPAAEDLADVPTKRQVSQISGEELNLESTSLEYYFDRHIDAPVREALDDLRLTEAISLIGHFYGYLDRHIQQYEPFRLVKTDPNKAGAVLWTVSEHLIKSAELLSPFMPKTAESIFEIIGHNVLGIKRAEKIIIEKRTPLFPSHAKHEREK